MGQKELLEEMQEEARNRNLARILGITYEELGQLEYNIETDESDEGLIYQHRVEFSANSPKTILQKIGQLEDGCRVSLLPADLD